MKGEFDFSVYIPSLMQPASQRKLLKQDGKVKAYRMPDGRVLLVAHQPDGIDYYMYWDPKTCTSLQEGAEWGVK